MNSEERIKVLMDMVESCHCEALNYGHPIFTAHDFISSLALVADDADLVANMIQNFSKTVEGEIIYPYIASIEQFETIEEIYKSCFNLAFDVLNVAFVAYRFKESFGAKEK